MKNFIALLLFAGVFGYAGWHFYSKDTVVQNRNFTEQIAILEKKTLAQKAELTLITNALETQKKAASMRQALAILTAQQKSLTDQKTALLKDKQKLLSSGRQTLIGVNLTDITLADGRKLDKARIIKVDDSGVSLAVSSGVIRLSPRDLTPELRTYFGFGN